MTKIIADTTCGLPLDELETLGIDVIPQIIIFDEQPYRDDTEIDTPTFLSKLQESKELPKTAAPPPALYEPLFKAYAEVGEAIIILAPSTELSGTFRSAEIAAENVPEANVHILDTRTIAGGLGVLVKMAKKWADDGMAAEEIIQKIKTLSQREVVYFLVDTLEYLYKGGRIGNASYLVGSVLQMKPILGLIDGKVDAIEKQRTSTKALNRLKELVLEECPKDETSYITVSHCGGEERAQKLAADLTKALEIDSIPVYVVPPAIVVHAGPGVIEVSFFKNS
ncbi:MAG: DegV family protein [Chloroflexota bacterium]|nr:DegV family protein [Chloroflexota bacterium]